MGGMERESDWVSQYVLSHFVFEANSKVPTLPNWRLLKEWVDYFKLFKILLNKERDLEKSLVELVYHYKTYKNVIAIKLLQKKGHWLLMLEFQGWLGCPPPQKKLVILCYLLLSLALDIIEQFLQWSNGEIYN